MKKLIFLTSLSIMISCASLKVITEVPYNRTGVESIVLVNTYIGRIHQPTLPLIDAGIFNKRTNKISGEIMDYQERIVKEIESDLVAQLSNNLKANVKPAVLQLDETGLSDLHSQMNFPEALLIDHDHYPKIISSAPHINPFPFEEGKALEYFEDNPEFRARAKKLCEIMGVDAIAVSYNYMNVVGIGAFGTSGNLRIESYLFMVDKNGMLIGKSKAHTKHKGVKGKELDNYIEIWEQYPILNELIALDIIKPKTTA